MIYKFVSGFLIWTFIFFAFPESNAQNTYKQLYASQCDSLIKANIANPDFVILDVRTHGEWVNDHLEGSINRSTGDAEFMQKLDALPKHKTFLLHCKSGGRSAGAFLKMKNLEFAEVYEMKGGLNSWKSNSYPTTAVHAPKIMLVSHTNSLKNLNSTDTINITVTNRANDLLTFSSATFNDFHEITNNFNTDQTLAGAEDYTFSVYHNPAYSEDDSTTVFIKSNGGDLEINIVYKNGVIQNIETEFDENELVLYPNPAKNNLYIKGGSDFSINNVSIINLNGKIVLSENVNSLSKGIDISELKDGIYITRIETDNKFYSKKIMIKR